MKEKEEERETEYAMLLPGEFKTGNPGRLKTLSVPPGIRSRVILVPIECLPHR